MSEHNSAAILDLLDGNRRSQELLYKQFCGYAGLCLRYAQSRDEAADIVNDGFFKIFTRLETFDSARPFKTRLGRVLINTALDQAEVPLNVRFDFSQRQKTRWFAGAGVSSYKMQEESYTYNYDTYVHNAAKGWGGSTGWYFLSHADASVGYERRLTERLSVVVEPYMRIPLRGVGFGKVNLLSGGVWFSLRYTPVSRK